MTDRACAVSWACVRACAGPEVLTGKYGTSQDVWSYGVTLFELMNHQLPFKTRDEVLHSDVTVPCFSVFSFQCLTTRCSSSLTCLTTARTWLAIARGFLLLTALADPWPAAKGPAKTARLRPQAVGRGEEARVVQGRKLGGRREQAVNSTLFARGTRRGWRR